MITFEEFKIKWNYIKTTNDFCDMHWVQMIVKIKCNQTNEIVQYEDQIAFVYEDYQNPNIFNWQQNNYSCDCNRRIFFERAKGNKNSIDEQHRCSDGKYSVNLYNKKDGKIFYQQFEQEL